MKMRHVSWGVGVLLLLGTLSAAEAAGNLTQVRPWMSLGSPAHALVVEGNYAYVATDQGLKIFDLSSLPAAPIPLGSINNLGLRGLGIAVNGNYVYVANQTKDLQIIDVSNRNAPVLVKTKTLPGTSWDVALKDDRASGGPLIAYVASFYGEVYVLDVTNHLNPVQVKVLGMIAWGAKAGDKNGLTKLRAHVVSGNGKVTGLAVRGDKLIVVEWAYGRFYYYDITTAANPVFAGTHYAPYTLRVAIDPAGETAYSLSAYGYTSGIYSVPLSKLGPTFSTRHENCDDDDCGYFPSPPTDFGGLSVSANGRYVMYIAGKQGEVQVVDVSNPDPTVMVDVGSVSIGAHQSQLAQSMGVAQYGDYIIAAGGALGLGVFEFPDLSLPLP